MSFAEGDGLFALDVVVVAVELVGLVDVLDLRTADETTLIDEA